MQAALSRVSVGKHRAIYRANIDAYRSIVGDELIEEIKSEAEELRGLRVCHVNSTPFGGGVAELLSREIPLLRSLGIEADWKVIHGFSGLFEATKNLHNALQGAPYMLSEAEREVYLTCNRQCGQMLDDSYDVLVVHDPQPAAARRFAGTTRAKWVWRCHIDSSEPNPEAWEFLRQFIEEYDAVVFTMEEFLPERIGVPLIRFIPPAIDPLSTKNMDIGLELCRAAMADSGVDVKRPVLLQVSRFDPWKDPGGVIETYRLVKREVPEVQLVLIGALAGDDPEGWRMLTTISGEAYRDEDVHVFTNLMGYGNAEVNMFQRGCDLVIQKSLREGFGLVVSEAFWKEKAVVAGRAGGIPMQFPRGYERYLVRSTEEAAAACVYLLQHPGEAAEMGRAGKEHIRRNFLLPRMVRDELRLLKDVLAV